MGGRRPGGGRGRRYGFRGIGAAGAAPVNVVAPVISVPGAFLIGETASCTTGTWTGSPAPTFTFQWQRAGGDIVGETASTYTPLVAADMGADITCDVTATNAAGTGTATSNALAFHPSQLTGAFAFYDASQVVQVGPPDVDVVEDQVTTGTPAGAQDLTAASPGERPALKSASASMGGQDSLDFVSGDRVQAAAAADWNTLHDGTGMTASVCVYQPVSGVAGMYVDTNAASSTTRGFALFFSGAANVLAVRAGNGAAVVFSVTPAMTDGAVHIITVRYLEGRGPKEMTVQIDGVEVSAVDSTNAPNAGDAAGAMALGETYVGGNPWTGEYGFALFSSAVLSAAEMASLEAYAVTYGVTLP